MKRYLVGLMYAVILLPFGNESGWQSLEYSKIPPNTIKLVGSTLEITVKKSASPLIFPLKESIVPSKILVKGSLSGLLKLPDGIRQGSRGVDDFTVRIGLVREGTRTLNMFQRMVAPSWVKKLFSLAPEGTGVSQIQFINAVQRKSDQGFFGKHKKTDLMTEENLWLLDSVGDFEFSKDLKGKQPVVAIWIAVDGDDSKSNFKTTFKEISLEFPDK